MSEGIEIERHGFITGTTDSGKTTFAAHYFRANDGLNIFFNVQEEYVVEENADIIVYTIDELETAIEEGYTRICFNPELAGEDVSIEDIDVTIRMMFAIGTIAKRQAKGRPDVWCTIYIDEVQEYGGKAGHPVIHRLFKRGLGYGIRGIAMSQRPADVSHTILTQSHQHVIFYVGSYDHPYFENYDIPIEEHMTHLETEYNFVIWDKRTITAYNKLNIH